MKDETPGQKERRADPNWYRIAYSLAAQRLHAAEKHPQSPDTEREEVPLKKLGVRTKQIISDLQKQETSALGLAERSAAQAEKEALALISETTQVLAGVGWPWVGGRRPWYTGRRLLVRLQRVLRRLTWRPRRRSAKGDRQLATFLDRTVEPAAVLLLWSARIEQGQEIPSLEEPGLPPPLDRRAFGGKDNWLERYVAELTTEKLPDRPSWQRLGAWLGFSRWRHPPLPNYRVQYNLACLFSRLAVQERQEDDEENIANSERQLRRSAHYLERCLAASTGPRRAEIAHWARRDPGLAGLRDLDRPRFKSIVGLAQAMPSRENRLKP